jgi:hypothetical protein
VFLHCTPAVTPSLAHSKCSTDSDWTDWNSATSGASRTWEVLWVKVAFSTPKICLVRKLHWVWKRYVQGRHTSWAGNTTCARDHKWGIASGEGFQWTIWKPRWISMNLGKHSVNSWVLYEGVEMPSLVWERVSPSTIHQSTSQKTQGMFDSFLLIFRKESEK